MTQYFKHMELRAAKFQKFIFANFTIAKYDAGMCLVRMSSYFYLRSYIDHQNVFSCNLRHDIK